MPADEIIRPPLRPKICAWCESPMGVEVARSAEPDEAPSHGLCADCTQQLIGSLTSEPKPRRRRRTRRRRSADVALA